MLEIFCKKDLKLEGKIYYREAVRSVIRKEEKILLIYSEKNGDYKLPGGGVEEGETYEEALIREVEEEAGYRVLVKEEILQVMEYDEGQFDDCDVFQMLSIYYKCEILEEKAQNLDTYEMEMGFIPVWKNIDEAIEENMKILEKNVPPRWTQRETTVLKYIKNN